MQGSDLIPRPALPEDAEALAACTAAAYGKFVPRLGRKPQPMAADYRQVVAEHQVWVVDGEAGCRALLVLIPGEDHLLIWSVAVRPDQQGLGLGRGLMAFAESEARRQGFSELRLYTNEKMAENIAFYRKLGYRESGREWHKDSYLVHMSLAVGAD